MKTLPENKKDVLIILNPRNHEPSMESLRSLVVPKVWITGYNERDALAKTMEVVEKTDRENYILISDDVIVEQEQLDVIIDNNKDYDVLTGYCRLHRETDTVNLVPAVFGKKLTLQKADPLTRHHARIVYHPVREDYPFVSYDSIQNDIEGDVFETYSVGFAFTSFKKHVLKKYPLQVYTHKNSNGYASDHHISYRIVNDGVYKMYAHKKCCFTHLKLKKRCRLQKESKVTYELG